MSGSGISWAVCKSAPRQITTPATHHSVFNRMDALPAVQPTASKHWRPTDREMQNKPVAGVYHRHHSTSTGAQHQHYHCSMTWREPHCVAGQMTWCTQPLRPVTERWSWYQRLLCHRNNHNWHHHLAVSFSPWLRHIHTRITCVYSSHNTA